MTNLCVFRKVLSQLSDFSLLFTIPYVEISIGTTTGTSIPAPILEYYFSIFVYYRHSHICLPIPLVILALLKKPPYAAAGIPR